MNKDEQNNVDSQNVDLERKFRSAVWNLTEYLIFNDPDLCNDLSEERVVALFERLCKAIRKDYCDGWAFLRINEIRRTPRAKKGEK